VSGLFFFPKTGARRRKRGSLKISLATGGEMVIIPASVK
jgi:hypothetical protein